MPFFAFRSGFPLACVIALGVAACGGASDENSDAPAAVDPPSSSGSGSSSSGAPPMGTPPPTSPPADGTCPTWVTAPAEVPLPTVTEAGEHTLRIDAFSKSKTSWAEKGNEAVVLEVLRKGTLVGHLVLHQGAERFGYGMHLGALDAGDALTVRVSPLTAANADKSACLAKVTLAVDASPGIANAPILVWPKKKVFDDVPVLAGHSAKGKSYQVVYTSENGGTPALCGGGAKGMRSEIARWGRGYDMEGAYSYGAGPSFGRCNGSATPRMDAAHPVLYYGDGHNRLFESRGGYGQACGTSGDAKADGDIDGWNANNPGNEREKDAAVSVVVRPLPFDLDAVPGRESLVDRYAPWIYRITASELAREGKIDGTQTLPLERYLYVDVYAADVGGKGDATCLLGPLPPVVAGGFVLRAVTKAGVVSNGPQMTADYFSGTLKRLAIPLAAGVTAKDVSAFVLDAYDDDGVYWLALGDAFVVAPSGDNGATLEYVSKGKKAVDVYVDDGKSGCTNDTIMHDGATYPCVGTLHRLDL